MRKLNNVNFYQLCVFFSLKISKSEALFAFSKIRFQASIEKQSFWFIIYQFSMDTLLFFRWHLPHRGLSSIQKGNKHLKWIALLLDMFTPIDSFTSIASNCLRINSKYCKLSRNFFWNIMKWRFPWEVKARYRNKTIWKLFKKFLHHFGGKSPFSNFLLSQLFFWKQLGWNLTSNFCLLTLWKVIWYFVAKFLNQILNEYQCWLQLQPSYE